LFSFRLKQIRKRIFSKILSIYLIAKHRLLSAQIMLKEFLGHLICPSEIIEAAENISEVAGERVPMAPNVAKDLPGIGTCISRGSNRRSI
jgi:hypothetical protein